MGDAEDVGRQAENSDLLDKGVRFGLVAYGVVYLMVAWLAAQLALGTSTGAKANSTGALQQLASQPFGKVLVWAVAVGMAVLVVWRLLEAAFGHREEDGGDRVRKRVGSGLKAVIYGALAVSAVKVALGHQSSGSSGGSKGFTAKVMGWPAGPWLVAAGGLAIVGYGLWTGWRGWKEKFLEHLDIDGRTGNDGKAFRLFGKAGYLAKGFAFVVVGILFVVAAIKHNPNKSGGLDQALRDLLQQPFGQVVLLVVAVGLACYGLFCFARARHLNR